MNPFSLWTELAFKLWGLGKSPAPSATPERKVEVAVIPTRDTRSPPANAARPQGKSKRAKGRARTKSKAKRARR